MHGNGALPHQVQIVRFRPLSGRRRQAKAVLGLTTTVGLIERLMIDRALRRICGFPLHKTLPS